MSANRLRIRIEAEEDALVNQWVLVLSPWTPGNLGIGRSDNSLDRGAVDDAGDIWVGYLGGGKAEDGEQRNTQG